jgi:hypothetical protein
VPGGHVEGTLSHGDVVHAVPEAPVSEPVLAHIEALALSAEQVFRRHHQVLDQNLRVPSTEDVRERPFDSHRLDVPDDLVPGIGQFNDERAELLVARCVRVRLRHDNRDVRNTGSAAEPLLAIQHPVVAIAHGTVCMPVASATAFSVIE